MRLTDHEVTAIKEAAREAFGPSAVVRLFGSKSIQRAGFAGGVEADNTIEKPKYELSSTDYDEYLACR